MDVYLRRILRAYLQELEEELDPMDVVDELTKHNIISDNDKKALEAIDSQEERVGKLISQLHESANGFHALLDALQKCGSYDDIVQKLERREQSAKKVFQNNIEEILSCPNCGKETFMFREAVCNTAEMMTKREAEKIAAYYEFSDKEKKSFQSYENPGFKVMELLLSRGLLKGEDVSTLELVFKELKLTNLGKGLQKYSKSLELPVLVINVKCPQRYLASEKDKVSHYELGKSLKSLFREKFNVIYEDFTPHSSLLLRIPYLSSLTLVSESIEGGTLSKMLVPLLKIKLSQENVDELQLTCDKEEYSRVRDHLLKEEVTGNTEESSAVLSDADFQSYLGRVGLNGHYPKKMTLKMATKVRVLQKYSPAMKESDIPLLFLTMLTSLDRRAVFPEKLNFNDSVRDFICSLLHCSDDFLKQHILDKLAACQLAVPVIIPHPTGGDPTFLLWALRRIVKKWKDDKDSLTPERNMVTEPLFTVAFLRIGELPVSKSHILNNMFGRAQSNSTVTYFITQREDYQGDATFSKGSLEAHWYVPLQGKDGEILDELTLFLNLRGDANEFPRQVKFASKVANMVFILVNKTFELQNKRLIETIEHVSSNVVTVSLREKIKKVTAQSRTKLIETDNRLEYEVDGEDIVLSKKLCELIKIASHQQNSKYYQCIEDWSKICRSLNGIIVDEDNPSCLKALEISKEAFTQMSSLTVQQIKERHMTLQKLELEWVKWDQKKESTLAGHTIEVQKDNIRMEKLKIRKEQLSRGLTPEMSTFYSKLRYVTVGEGSKLLHYFMFHVQAQIDRMTKKEIPPHITKINMLENELAQKKLELKQEKNKNSIDILEERIAKLQQDILRESKEYSHKHIGFEHFMRELSHLFEAQNLDPQCNPGETQMIAALAARLLIDGYPLELLDGDTTYISINWISNILNIVDKILKSPKIFVISVIGVQSSGKSTLLNSMFGVRFTVRAGRCTRGLFLQMLEVDSTLQESLGFQYLLIIDTEGLQSPDRTVKNDFKFDNSLATLAMCVVDLSILNISQETIGSDMIGILQIAAHALIRMKKVQLVSQCRIVHQRVSDVNAAGENKSSMNVIREALDKATLAAAKEENITGIKEFSDIFPFTESDNLYVPCLWMGNMSPPNHAYSETILHLKSQILLKTRDSTDFTQFTLKKFQIRLKDVWDALKKEDFVFNSQNSFNAISYQRFRLEHNKWIGVLRTAMVEWELMNKENIVEGNKEAYNKELKKEIKLHLDKVLKEIDEYITTHSDEEEVKRQQNTFKISSHNIAREIEEAIKNKYDYYMKTEREKASPHGFIENCKNMLRENAKQKAIEIRRNDPTLDPNSSKNLLEQMFHTFWKDISEMLKAEYEDKKVKDEYITSACENSLSTLIDKTRYNLKFQEIITSRGGIIVPTKTLTKVQKQPKQSKTNWTKVLSFGLLSGSDKNDSDHEGKKVIERIATEELKTFTDDERFEAFDKNHIDKFFTTLLEKLREPMQLAEDFALEILVQMCNHIATVSISKQRKYEDKYCLYELMEVEKISLKKDFFSFFDNTLTTQTAAEKTYSEICVNIRNKLVDYLNVQLLTRLRKSNHFTDREFLIGTILCEICTNRSRQDYLKFVSNQNEYIGCWLKKEIIKEVTERDNSQLWIEQAASQKLENLKEVIKNCLNVTKIHFENQECGSRDTNPSSTNFRDNEQPRTSKECSIPVSQWQNIFVKNCKENQVTITLGPMIFDSVHYISFTAMLLKMIETTSLSNIKLDPELRSCGDLNSAEK
ncbi:Interferon-induced very large GTPase 1 [Holothuria leucospilota]|uniref:Interferon-induced very large GTPase 1 n=1 Tax=Holothuria leucospilota TaxID=206669 RepID=A0A9Q0YKF1_HOLLE|nr:Interferon-induced very large GTPase 1 [Holothuria leucospilota]